MMLHILFFGETAPFDPRNVQEAVWVDGQPMRHGRGWHNHPHPNNSGDIVKCLTINTNIVEQELFGVSKSEYDEAKEVLEELGYDDIRTFSPATLVAQATKVERRKQGDARAKLEEVAEKFGPVWETLVKNAKTIFDDFNKMR